MGCEFEVTKCLFADKIVIASVFNSNDSRNVSRSFGCKHSGENTYRLQTEKWKRPYLAALPEAPDLVSFR